jgi:DNA-binding winged helix-turn-helix (wHTH) protein
MLNLLTAEKIKLFRSKKLWIVLGILFLFPIMQVVNSHVEVINGKELIQPIDTVINGATAILMIKKNGFTILLVLSAFISFFIGEEFHNIYESVWDEPFFYSDNTINMHISNLRNKLNIDDTNYIKTVWGIGFKFD